MTRAQALPYVSFIADDAGSFRKPAGLPCDDIATAVLVGWQCGDDPPLFVAVKSYLPGIVLEPEEAVELATDGVKEFASYGSSLRLEHGKWVRTDPHEAMLIHCATHPPDYVLLPEDGEGRWLPEGEVEQ